MLKKNLRRRSAEICLFLFAVSACTAPSPTDAPDSRKENGCAQLARQDDRALASTIDPVVEDAINRGFAGGVTVLRDGAVVYQRVAGNASLAQAVPVTEETLFHVASVSKYFTAALVLKAAEEGMLSLDDPLIKFAPDMTLAARGVKIIDLLLHRSGLGSSYAAEQETDRDAALAAIDNAPFDPEKMGQYNYSNDGYDLLGVLLERIYDRSYEDLLHEKLLAPACLGRVRLWGEVDLSDPEIVSQPLKPLPPALVNRNYGMLSSAGLLISAEDLAVYQWALAGGKVLEAASVERLFEPRTKRRADYGTFGGFWLDHDILGAKLSARGYEDWGDNAILIHYLDKEIIVSVVTSRGPAEDSGARPFRSALSNAIEKALADAALQSQ